MMKKLVVLFIAVAALFAFSACEPYAVTLDEPGEIEVNDVGIQNYNLSGKTLVRETYGYIKKTVETIMIVTNDNGTTTSSSSKIEKIPCSVETHNDFAADGTYTSTRAGTYLAGADGDYRKLLLLIQHLELLFTKTTIRLRYYEGFIITDLDELVTGRRKDYLHLPQPVPGNALPDKNAIRFHHMGILYVDYLFF